MRERQLLVDRADVDDFSAGLGAHAVLDESLSDKKQAL